jgi:hypothetical protein
MQDESVGKGKGKSEGDQRGQMCVGSMSGRGSQGCLYTEAVKAYLCGDNHQGESQVSVDQIVSSGE